MSDLDTRKISLGSPSNKISPRPVPTSVSDRERGAVSSVTAPRSNLSSFEDRPFGCPPDKPRCSCGSKGKVVGAGMCGHCYRQLIRQQLGAKRSKYGAVRTEVDGITFASKGEAKRYTELKLLEQAGYIRNLELQPKYEIKINGKHVCNVVLDFRYFEGATRQVEDFKGRDTPLSRLKRKLVEAACPGTKVKVTR